ncbi:hypothetical protein E4L96_01795 [Massilia arenosa]|uniref:Uncharacterized protein n=1 Tax=Zemynaea arenosa TaxID=2561931 RepID=A0A4Y9SV45_9BURK|nr:DUF5985 family protein [Massilia arenosa]TFW29084.1 hypothetical protein E4L96_01795 [Massilia arenosa]
MGTLIYTLCALTSLAVAWVLLRSYRQTGYRLLMWSGACFAGLTFNNLLLVLDKVIFPVEYDFSLARALSALVAVLLLLYGLIYEKE